MLDGAAGADGLEDVEREGVRPVADRVDRGHESGVDGPAGDGHEVVELPREHAGPVGHGRGPGAEGAVGDDLERPHRQQAACAVDDVAGAEPAVDHGVEFRRVDARRHPQCVGAGVDPARPAVEAEAHLEVDDARHAAGGSGLGRVGDVPVEQVVRHLRECTGHVEGVLLAQDPVVTRLERAADECGEVGEREGVAPDRVQVTADDDGREARCGLVEQLASCGGRPQPVAVAVSDQHAVRRPGPRDRCEEVGGRLRGVAAGDVDAAAHQRPLVEVRVVVAEAGAEPRAGGLDDLGVGARGVERAGRRDLGDPAVGDADVGRGPGGAHPADGPEQDLRHRSSRSSARAACARSISSASAGDA